MVGELERHRGVLLDQQHADAARRALIVRRMPKSSRTTSGASPNEGSSSSISLRRAASARATPRASAARRRRACPPAGGGARAGAGNSRTRARRSRATAALSRARVRAEPQVLFGRELQEGAAAVGHVRDAAGARCPRSRCRRCARRRRRISPCVRTMPQIARSVVVLPAPFAPSSAVIDALCRHPKSMPCSTCGSAP